MYVRMYACISETKKVEMVTEETGKRGGGEGLESEWEWEKQD